MSTTLPAGDPDAAGVTTAAVTAEHAFWLFGFPILVLSYRIRRKGGAPAP